MLGFGNKNNNDGNNMDKQDKDKKRAPTVSPPPASAPIDDKFQDLTFQDLTQEPAHPAADLTAGVAPKPEPEPEPQPQPQQASDAPQDAHEPQQAPPKAEDDAELEFTLEPDTDLNLGKSPTSEENASEALETNPVEEKEHKINLPTTSQNKGRMGDQMVEMGLISKDQLNVALQEKKISGEMIGAILVNLGFISENDLIIFLAETSGFGVFDPKSVIYDSNALALFDKEVAKKCAALPISIKDNEYYFAMVDPHDVVALDTIRRHLPKNAQVKPLIATDQVLSDSIDSAYGYASSISEILKELEEKDDHGDITKLDEKDAYSHPIVRLVNAVVFDAVKIGASDLHFEPEENFVRVRYRLDGVLFTAQTLHRQHWNGISQRLKIMSNLDIADKISAQDGRFNLNIAGREADFRVSSLPTVHGENIVLRVLDKSASIMPMEALGFSDENRERIRIAQSKPEGIIIVTGPTGSGKTTSLYSMLNEINDVEVNIQTLEDPVEYSLPMIRQTHVRDRKSVV